MLNRLLLSHVFHQLSRADFRAVHVALCVHRHTLRCAGSLHFERIGTAVKNLAVLHAADPAAPLPSRMEGPIFMFDFQDAKSLATRTSTTNISLPPRIIRTPEPSLRLWFGRALRAIFGKIPACAGRGRHPLACRRCCAPCGGEMPSLRW